MAKATIYHNPRCGKSRNTLKILEEKNVENNVVEYLKTPPTFGELKSVVKKLKIKPEELLRKGESVFKENYKGKSLSDDEWIRAMVDNPILIERPIVIVGDKAVIGRPPENVLEII
ncbi:arsenate reductase (glutaredoxin) [Fulvivirga lutea]|uniref:Arsenate reductase (Glutaredoxin) n=1 Tax=Fulvivirga lutea TaxID=2810512 RepID=A0A974WFM6_9BACT|nr:arsenate reductase (glutaredoxin) [Fulvivirga lutea]QSE96874.1 arsenate reductase (glutaredoxin) [Fulvivirga lutea]